MGSGLALLAQGRQLLGSLCILLGASRECGGMSYTDSTGIFVFPYAALSPQ